MSPALLVLLVAFSGNPGMHLGNAEKTHIDVRRKRAYRVNCDRLDWQQLSSSPRGWASGMERAGGFIAEEPEDYGASCAGGYEPEEEPVVGCSHCGNISFSQEWHKAFGVMLCNSCKKEEKLISKV